MSEMSDPRDLTIREVYDVKVDAVRPLRGKEFEVLNDAIRAYGRGAVPGASGAMKLYDVAQDTFREVTQQDVSALTIAAERGALQRSITQNVLTMDVRALRELARWLRRPTVTSVAPTAKLGED